MKILCIGDSTTYGMGVLRHNTWVHIAAAATGHTAINKGICGDTSSGMLARLNSELSKQKPDAVMIIGGINDFIVGGTPAQAAVNIMAIVAQLIALGKVPIVSSPIPFDAKHIAPKWGYPDEFIQIDALLLGYREQLRKIAGIFNAPFFDLYGEFVQAREACGAAALYIDGLHLNTKGHAVLAEIVSKHWSNIL